MEADKQISEAAMHQQHQIDYRRVERGIAYIAAHFREGPALEDVAAGRMSARSTSSACSPPGPASAPRPSPAISASTTLAVRFVTVAIAFAMTTRAGKTAPPTRHLAIAVKMGHKDFRVVP